MSIYDSVRGNNPPLNRFNLSYSNLFSAKIGLLYPVGCDEVYPADVFHISGYCHAEVQPMVAPIMSDLNIIVHSFFVPYRLIYGVDNTDGKSIWEKFITGGKDGDYSTPLTSWTPNFEKHTFSSETIWDMIGNPVDLSVSQEGVTTWTPIVPSGLDVSIAPKLAYNFIYNNYYISEDLMEEVDLFDNEDLLPVTFKKDYFTSALEYQQRGTSPALPVDVSGTISVPVSGTASGTASITLSGGDSFSLIKRSVPTTEPSTPSSQYVGASSTLPLGLYLPNSQDSSKKKDIFFAEPGVTSQVGGAVGTSYDNIGFSFSGSGSGPISGSVSGLGTADLSTASVTTFDISDLRLAFAIQRLQELSMRSGYRYTEYLSSNFGASPTDSRLDRPEYIGGCQIPINVSPSVQTSSTGEVSAQGNKVGIASADSVENIGSYRVLEHGLIMTLLSIRPKPTYQQGINRQWLRQTRWDYYNPAFASLSEQGVYNAEIYVDPSDSLDSEIFGYQAHWNEMRSKNNIVCGSVKKQFDFWSLSRIFGSRPHLNSDFLKIRDEEFNRAFAVQNEDEFIISWSNILDTYRPIPMDGVPGLVDHVYGGL